MFKGAMVLRRKSLAEVGTLMSLLGASILIALRYAIKYGWLAGNTHWLMHRHDGDPDRWYT